MRNVNNKDLNTLIKAGLQICNSELNIGKKLENEYRLFNKLAELYLLKESVREYPKVAAIYQYLKKLVEKHLNGDKEKLAIIDQRIKEIELKFLERIKVQKAESKSIELEVISIGSYIKELSEFRKKIKKELAVIEDLGIEKDKEGLNEEGLRKRAQEVERIYMGIREFFIGKRDEAGALAELGLVNKLINDCIKQLGELPKAGKDNHEVEYAIFGMGSMALGTMTPWSDLEFGILIEEGLAPADEARVKEYFRQLTTLLHIKVISFGETPLRMMGIKELNNFKITEESDPEYNWFYDNLIDPGFSFDGPHWHACKTPLGRSDGYQKVTKTGRSMCTRYELIDPIDKLMNFYSHKESWHRGDKQLLQGLGHVVLINGNPSLIVNYLEKLKEHREVIESLAFEMLKEDSRGLNPFEHILDEDKEGQTLNVKREIYRFPDRIIVALGDCLGAEGASSWKLIGSTKIGEKQKQALQIALGIATEIRLRTYSNNDGQKEDMSALAMFEPQVKELDKDKLLKQIFYLKDKKILYHYFQIMLEFAFKLTGAQSTQFLPDIGKITVTTLETSFIKGYIFKRFLQYDDAIKELEKVSNANDNIAGTLAKLYSIVGRNEKALKYYQNLRVKYEVQGDYIEEASILHNIGIVLENQGKYEDALKIKLESLKIEQMIYKGDYISVASALNSIGLTLQNLGRYEKALEYFQKSLDMYHGIYKGNHISIALVLNNRGLTLQSLGRYEEALEQFQKSLGMSYRIYKGVHRYIGQLLNNIGHTLLTLNRYKEALHYQQDGLGMRRRIYKGDHPEVAMSLTNMGAILQSLGRYEEALKYYQESLGMLRRVHTGDHPDIGQLLNNIGITLKSLGRYEEALRYRQEGLEIKRRIYKEDHLDIAKSLDGIGYSLASLNKYEEALGYQKESFEMLCRIYKGDHPEKARSLCSRGDWLANLSRYEEALSCYQQSLEMSKRTYKGDGCDVAKVLNNVGVTLERLERYEDALRCYQESLEMRRKIYKGDHADIAISFNNAGATLERLERYEDALRCYQESLEMRRKIYKGDHADIASSLNNVGNTLESLGRNEEALQYYQESLEMVRRIYKGDHADITVFLNNIGATLERLERYEDALKYHQDSLEMQQRIYKDDHADIASSLNNVGNTLESLGRNEEALQHYQESLEMVRRIYKGDHADIAISLNNAGATLDSLGRLEEALKYKQESLEIRRRIYKGDHADIASSLNNVSNTLESLGKFDEALKYHQESLEIRRRIYKGDHINIAGSLNNIGITLVGLSKFDEALKYHQESLEMSRRIYKDDHSDIASSLNNVSNTLESLGRFEEALKYHQEGLEMRRRIYKGDHADIASSLNNIGNTLESLGRFEEALKYQQESLEMRHRIYKDDHTDLETSLNNIGNILESLGRFDEALKYQQESLEMRHRIYKSDHASIVASLNNIGGTLQREEKKQDEVSKEQQNNVGEEIEELLFDEHIKKADELLKQKDDTTAEKHYAKAMHLAFDAKDYLKQMQGYQKLALVYLSRKDYLKATAIFNMALAIVNDVSKNVNFKEDIQRYNEVIIESIKATEERLLEAVEAVEARVRETSNNLYRKGLLAIRDQAKIKLLQQKTLKEKLNSGFKEEVLFHERALRIQAELELNKLSIENIYRDISVQTINFIKQLIEDCKNALGEEPCGYAIIGLGSLARSEATPYSDLEFAILIEKGKDTEQNKEYFRSLIKLLFIKVINLGETTARAMNIESLNWLSEDESPTKRGFSLDGQMKGACKTPLGNYHISGLKEEERFELIKTPKGMARFHNEENYLKDKYLSTVLFTYVTLYGDEYLVKEYSREVEKILNGKVNYNGQYLREERGLSLLLESIYRFKPMLGQYDEDGHYFNVKFDLYRLPNMFMDHLIYYYGLIKPKSIWDRIEAIFGVTGIFKNTEGARNLKLVASKILEIRLRACIESNNNGKYVLHLTEINSDQCEEQLVKQFGITLEELFEIYYTIMPLYDGCNIFHNEKGDKQHQMFKTGAFYFYKDPYIEAIIYDRLKLYNNALLCCKEAKDKCKDKETGYYITLLNLEGKIYDEISKYRDAINCYDEALKVCKRIFGDKHYIYSKVLVGLGIAHDKIGQYKKAIDFYESVLAIRENVFNEHGIAISVVLDNLGDTYEKLGQYEEGEKCYKRALEIKQNKLGQQSLQIAYTLNGLGNLYKAQGKYIDARNYFDQGLSIRKRILGNRHPLVADILNSIANLYSDLREFNKAIEIYQQNLLIYEERYGKKSLDYNIILLNIGGAYIDLNEPGKSLEPLNIALLQFQDFYKTDNHINVCKVLVNLGVAHSKLGLFNLACEHLKKAEGILITLFNLTHPLLANLYMNLANVYLKMNDYIKAENYYNRALRIANANLGESHPDVAHIYENKAALYLDRGLYKESEGMYLKALKIFREKFNKYSMRIAELLDKLSFCYFRDANYKSATDRLLEAIELYKYNRVPEKIINAYIRLGICYINLEDYEKAEEAYIKIFSINERNKPELSIAIAKSINELAVKYESIGKIQEALKYYFKSLEIFKEVLGEGYHAEIAQERYNLSIIYEKLEQYDKAKDCASEAVTIYNKTLGKQHNDTFDAMKQLIRVSALFDIERCFYKVCRNNPTLSASSLQLLTFKGVSSLREVCKKFAKEYKPIIEKVKKDFIQR